MEEKKRHCDTGLWDRRLPLISQSYASYKNQLKTHILSYGLDIISDGYYIRFSPEQENFIAHVIDHLFFMADSKEDFMDLYHVTGILFERYEKDNGGILMTEEEEKLFPDSAAPYWMLISPCIEDAKKRSLFALGIHDY